MPLVSDQTPAIGYCPLRSLGSIGATNTKIRAPKSTIGCIYWCLIPYLKPPQRDFITGGSRTQIMDKVGPPCCPIVNPKGKRVFGL